MLIGIGFEKIYVLFGFFHQLNSVFQKISWIVEFTSCRNTLVICVQNYQIKKHINVVTGFVVCGKAFELAVITLGTIYLDIAQLFIIFKESVRFTFETYQLVYALDDRAKLVNMLADIGNGTINILRIRNGVVIEDSLHTEMLGVNECVKEILHSLKDKTFTNVDESVALDFIKTGESSISEVYVDEMKRIISIYCGKVMKLLTRNGYNRDFMNLYICGGGARLMKKFCPAVANDDKVFLMTNICAAAKGYELMSEKMLRDQYEKE